MKKRVAGFLCLLLCLSIIPVVHAERTPIEISTPEGLAAIASDPYGSYVLTADIDMEGADWTPLAFYGRFDGAGHTIYNLTVQKLGPDRAETVDGNAKKYDTAFAGLFSVVKDAEIKNLNLLNVEVRIETNENCYAAGLAGFAENTTVSGCSVQGRVRLDQSNWMCGVAGIVGFGYGTIKDCTADVELVFVDTDMTIKCEEFLGGVVGNGYMDVENCTVRLTGYASVQGYVHNGGVIGMYYVYIPADKSHSGYVKGCTVDATISFYENNRDRRAYCKAYIGETLHHSVSVSKNTTVYFRNGETRDYGTVLLPETDENPQYEAAVTPPTCTQYGYTTYTCKECGYSYTDDYVPFAHTPGEWETVVEPTYTQTGLERRSCTVCGEILEERVLPVHVAGDWETAIEPTYETEGLRRKVCTVCGDVLEEEAIPKLVYVSFCSPNWVELEMTYKAEASLHASIRPSDASNREVVWSSSDPEVATVDSEGRVRACARGEAVITCASADGNASGECIVHVRYTLWQWIAVYILFGWIWY